MKILTILCASATNPITAVSTLLANQKIDIRAMDFKQIGDNAFLSLRVDEYDQSLAILINAGYRAISNEVVLLQAEDRPGELAYIAQSMTEHGIEIRSLNIMANMTPGNVIAVTTSDNEKVRRIFKDVLVN